MDTITFVMVADTDRNPQKQEWVQNTPEALEDAARRGLPYRSLYSFSSIPDKDAPAPYLYGDLWIVTNDRSDRVAALEAMRRIMDALLALYPDIEPGMLRRYLDSEGSVYLRIPAVMFGGEFGIPFLPLYHRQMVARLLDALETPRVKLATADRIGSSALRDFPADVVLAQPYDLWPFLFLPPGRGRGGRFTVEIDHHSFMDIRPDEVWLAVENGYRFAPRPVAPAFTSLCELYESIAFKRCVETRVQAWLDALDLCPFFQACREHPEAVDGTKRALLFGLLAPLDKIGLGIALDLGERMPGCSASTLRSEFADAVYERRLVTCADIAPVHGCDGSCAVHTPYDREAREQAGAAVLLNYQERKDGLYFSATGWETEEIAEERVCSPISITSKVCNAEGTGWAREVVVEAPDGKRHCLTIPLRECMTQSADSLLTLLCDHGLELAPGKHAAALLKRYFREASPARIKVGVKALGWQGDCYVLPDMVIGHYDRKPEYLGKTGAFQASGSLTDWISRVGCLCQGNSLPMLLVQFALTGPLLKPCGLEGGGLHLYGPSSSGKTTLALVAGSVCGGKPGRGNLSQWRSTSNALEATAARHNDGLLVLDELGEAAGDTVFQASYMLTNGQGKERLKADASARKTHQWLLNYLSTGELSTGEKVEENGRRKVMAGQEVRIINLPVLGADGGNVYTDLHGFATPADLSDHLKRAAKEVYGTLLRAFLMALCGSTPDKLHANIERIMQDTRAFVERVCPKEGAGQLYRVAVKFGLIAAAGAFAARHALLPWSEREAGNVAEEWFRIWLENRGGTGNLEVEKAIKNIQDCWARNKESRFMNLDSLGDGSGFPREVAGFYWRADDEVVFFLKAEVFSDLARSANRKELLDAMQEKGMLLMTKAGTRMETKSINGQNIRGVGFRPSSWLGQAEVKEMPESVASPDTTPILDAEAF